MPIWIDAATRHSLASQRPDQAHARRRLFKTATRDHHSPPPSFLSPPRSPARPHARYGYLPPAHLPRTRIVRHAATGDDGNGGDRDAVAGRRSRAPERGSGTRRRGEAGPGGEPAGRGRPGRSGGGGGPAGSRDQTRRPALLRQDVHRSASFSSPSYILSGLAIFSVESTRP